MMIYVIQKKASSYKELAREKIEIKDAYSLEGLLIELVSYFLKKQQTQINLPLQEEDIHTYKGSGKIMCNESYQGTQISLEKAVNTMIQDFKDGLFRVYFNQKEYTDLQEHLVVLEENEVVFIRMVMMAGRLW